MQKKRKTYRNGIALVLAWPKTYCKQARAWYDPIMRFIGFNQKGYYRVGHAAIVLIKQGEELAHYFDFGRYHAPFQHGRVRSAQIDPELRIKTKAQFEGGLLTNPEEILEELGHNEACHGDGPLVASVMEIDFSAALEKALDMQRDSPLTYGPFVKPGTNCSRFVNTVLQAGQPHWPIKWKLKFPITLSPTPMSNVKASRQEIHTISAPIKYPLHKLPKPQKGVLLPPGLPAHLPENTQWLAGEGAGSWFVYKLSAPDTLHISRHDPAGKLEFSQSYINTHKALDLMLDFEFVHSCDFEKISLTQGSVTFLLGKSEAKNNKRFSPLTILR